MIAPMRLHSGRMIDIAEPDPSALSLDDIAYHLAGINRWTGASRFTVAQHCVDVWHRMCPGAPPWALLHDAEEAIVGDVGHWLKRLLGDSYRQIALGWRNAVAERFGVEIVDVSIADEASAQAEALSMWDTCIGVEPSDPRLNWNRTWLPPVRPWEPERARKHWLHAAHVCGLK